VVPVVRAAGVGVLVAAGARAAAGFVVPEEVVTAARRGLSPEGFVVPKAWFRPMPSSSPATAEATTTAMSFRSSRAR
jgi:hypothetical protein